MDFMENFELQELSLEEFLSKRRAFYLHLKEIRPILHQVATALSRRSNCGAAHADLTPQNIRNVDGFWKPLHTKQDSSVPSVYYRAPEVILGLPRMETTDVWSLGCIAVELFLGFALYPAICEYDVIWSISQIIGQFPQHLLSAGPQTSKFFLRNRTDRWRMMSPAEYGITPMVIDTLRSLDEIKKFQSTRYLSNAEVVQTDLENFVDLIKRMLHPNPEQRLAPGSMLQHPFLTMQSLMELFAPNPYVQSCCRLMDFCYPQSKDLHQEQRSEDRPTTQEKSEQPIPEPSQPALPSNRNPLKRKRVEEKLKDRCPDSASPNRKRIRILFNPKDDPKTWKSSADHVTQQPPEQGRLSNRDPPRGGKVVHVASPGPHQPGSANSRKIVLRREAVTDSAIVGIKPQRKEEQDVRSSPSTGTTGKDKPVPKIWLVGSSYIRRAEDEARLKFGENLGLSANVEWFGKGGMGWSGVLPCFYSEVLKQSPPDVLVVHAGGNDLGLVSAAQLITAMQRDLMQLHQEFPRMKILLSSINERQQWRYGPISKIVKDKQLVNGSMRQAAESFGGLIIEHPLLRHDDDSLFLPDRVHFSRKGNALFTSGIRAAIMETLQQMSL